jgi:hypothetical protein
MVISTHGWDQVTLSDVARVTYAARKNSPEQRDTTPEGLEEKIRESLEGSLLWTKKGLRGS